MICRHVKSTFFQNQQQANAAKIWVGDPQQIYSFHGAVDAMDGLHAMHVHSLTQSFWFGPNIASTLASMSLPQTLKLRFKKVNGEKNLVGMPIKDSILGEVRTYAPQNTTIICRTNHKVYSEADAVTSPEYSHFWSENGTGPRPKIHIYGTAEQHLGYFNDVMDLLHLMNNCRCDMESEQFSRYFNFEELEKNFIASEDLEVLGKIDFVRKYKERNLPEVLERLRCHMNIIIDFKEIISSSFRNSR
jgi:F-box protein 18 (helicase)